MRPGGLGSLAYSPLEPPAEPKALQGYLREELRRVAAALRLVADGHIDPVHVAPTKVREGDIRLADGTDWDPGSGAGVYAYYGAAWHKLG